MDKALLAEAFGVTRSTVNKWIAQGVILDHREFVAIKLETLCRMAKVHRRKDQELIGTRMAAKILAGPPVN